MGKYVMTARRKAALKKAQLASARRRKKNAPKRYSSKRGSYARKADKMSRSKSRTKRAAAWMTRGNGGSTASIAYRVSKRRGKKAGQLKKKRRSKKR